MCFGNAFRFSCEIDQQYIKITKERCSLEPVGEFVSIDFANILKKELPTIADESFDLVTMNQGRIVIYSSFIFICFIYRNKGLHHLPPSMIGYFIDAVTRILRPGGIFIVREHDMGLFCTFVVVLCFRFLFLADENLRPYLDCAHMVERDIMFLVCYYIDMLWCLFD